MKNHIQNREVAIKLSDVKKIYKLGQIGGGTLQGDIQSWWAKVRGKEDPNAQIGQKQRISGQSFMALNGIDLTVYRGEALGIIGGNGAGKSTMLKLLSRVTAPTDGTIDIHGRITSMLEVGTGFNGEMTGRENIYMNGAILGMTKAEIDAKMEDIIEFSEVRDFIDTPVKRYSSGMYVKLAFSVAAHLDSEIMIMDEVLAVGDMAFQKKCLNKMRDVINREGRTVLYVSHNMNTIRQLCDRCVVLQSGKIVYEGDVEEGISRYIGKDIHKYENNIVVLSSMRELGFENPCVEIERINVNNATGIVELGSGLTLGIKICNKKDDNKKIFLRIIIKTIDGEAVTMLSTQIALSLLSKQSIEKNYYVDVSNLVPGKYTLSFVLYEIGELGADRNIEILRDIYSFNINNKMGFNHDMPWNSQWWGHFFNGYLLEA